MSWIQVFANDLHALEWVGILVARVAVGLLFFLSGCGKLFVLERRDKMLQTLLAAHVPFAKLNVVVVSTVELVCGLLLIMGALTPLASAMLGCVMLVAIATSALGNIKASCPVAWVAEFLYLPEVLYLVILIWLFFSDPGWLSVDYLILPRTTP